MLVAVDEGLLELAPNESWKLLTTMMQRRGMEVDTSTASMQVVGKRHYGRKARDAGGGGGRKTSRELFDTLLFWKARLKLDEQGRATAEIPLNDSITSFRIVAVATGDADLFGTGQTSIRSTQELMLFSGLPPMVREQDSYRATFTVRNASDKAQDVEVRATLSAESQGKGAPPVSQQPLKLKLAPGLSQEIGWDVKAPVNADSLRWEVTAASMGADASQDTLKVSQRVIPAVAVRAMQATMTQIDRSFELPVEIPADAIPGRGGVKVSLMPTPGGRAFRRSRIHEWISLYLSRAAGFAGRGVARPSALVRGDGRTSQLSRPRWLRQVFPGDALWQRRAHGVSALDCQ